MDQRVSPTRTESASSPPDTAERPSTPADPKPGTKTPKVDAAPEPDAGAKTSEARQDRRGVLRRHPLAAIGILLAVVALGVGAYFYWLTFVHPFETTDDAFVDARDYAVAPKVSGYVVDVDVTDNQHVEAGAVLFQIDRRDYEVAVEQAEAGVEAAEAAIANVDAQIAAQQAQVDVAKAQVEQSQASLKFAQEDAARYTELADKGAGSVQREQQTRSTLQQQLSALSQAKANVTAAERQVGSLKAQRKNAEAQAASAKAKLDQANLDLDHTTVRAAQSGRVVRLSGAKGQFAQAGAGLSNFVPDDIWITANFKETQVTDMRPGQAVDVEIDAYPDRDVKGHVDSVQPGSGTAFSLLPAENATGNYVKVTQRIPVKIVVDDWPKDVAIGPGMSVVPTVHVR